jgi:hypothetical protein
MLTMRAGQAHFFTGLSGHTLQFKVKVKDFTALGTLETIHFPLPISYELITTLEILQVATCWRNGIVKSMKSQTPSTK